MTLKEPPHPNNPPKNNTPPKKNPKDTSLYLYCIAYAIVKNQGRIGGLYTKKQMN